MQNMIRTFGWLDVIRLGLVQACLGAMVVLATSTLNRIMVVELALPALLPGLLVALHYLVQMIRPRLGFGADQGRRCTPWMMMGMVCLAVGGNVATWATIEMAQNRTLGIAVCALGFVLIGVGVSACGTSLLALMAKRVPQSQRAPAATTVWVMMIMGFALTAFTIGRLIDPYSPERLMLVTQGLGILICVIAALALWGLEPAYRSGIEASLVEQGKSDDASMTRHAFGEALRLVWQEPQAKCFTVFVFLSMLAYSTQDLVLEPFAGSLFDFSPGQSTQLSGVHHSGVLMGMLLVAFAGSRWVAGRLGSTQIWMVCGCVGSALAMAGLSFASWQAPSWPLKLNVLSLGVANGIFSIAAIATMMRLANASGAQSQGIRMGLWGAAQAIAFGLGNLLGTLLSDVAHVLLTAPAWSYASVFLVETILFLWATRLAVQVGQMDTPPLEKTIPLNTTIQRIRHEHSSL